MDERAALVRAIGEDLLPPAIVKAMRGNDQWRAIFFFCKAYYRKRRE